MAGEAAFWDWLLGRITGQIPSYAFDAQRLEVMVTQGVPDVNFCLQGKEFWWELKALNGIPARPATPLRFERYTLDQRNWLRRRWRCGGRAFLLLRILTPGVVVAWTGEVAWDRVEGRTWMDALGASCGRWPVKGFSARTFLRDLNRVREMAL